jgi:hypothetical protein
MMFANIDSRQSMKGTEITCRINVRGCRWADCTVGQGALSPLAGTGDNPDEF